MKRTPSERPKHAPPSCDDGFCATLDRLGVPRDSKWRALILFMRSIKEYEVYTPEQKRQVQELVMQVLKEGGLTEAKFQDIVRMNEDILSEPWRARLEEALGEIAQIINSARELILRRKGDLEVLELSTVETLRSGHDLDRIIGDIRRGFQDVILLMEKDADDLAKQSRTDQLTGLGNRRAFDDLLESAVERSRAEKRPMCLIMLDVDHFKAFNDQFGHLVGDQALCAVASVLRDCQKHGLQPDQDVFSARYGGEEFAVIIQDILPEQTVGLAENIRARIEHYNFVLRDLDGRIITSGIKLTVSLGVACLQEHWTDYIDRRLVQAADAALYEAKAGGRNRVVMA